MNPYSARTTESLIAMVMDFDERPRTFGAEDRHNLMGAVIQRLTKYSNMVDEQVANLETEDWPEGKAFGELTEAQQAFQTAKAKASLAMIFGGQAKAVVVTIILPN